MSASGDLGGCDLCKPCQSIDFGSLRLPTYDNLNTYSKSGHFSHSSELVHFDGDVTYPARLSLGPLRRIKASSADCPLCDLIWQILIRQNYGEEPQLVGNEPAPRDLECFIWAWPYGNFTDPGREKTELRQTARTLHNMVRRLSLRIGVPAADHEDDEDCAWWDIWHCIQACAVNGISLDPFQAWRGQSSHALAFGGRQRPLCIDIEWLRQWIELCDHAHGSNCHVSKERESSIQPAQPESLSLDAPDLPEIRLINVTKWCIESFHANNIPAYAALSYVWGKDQRLKLRQANENMLMLPNALVENPPAVTIIDAIEVIAQLSLPGLNHIWVDALCIVQDSDLDKQNQIGRMGRTYTEASITIVAASGEDADAGLPGLRAGSRNVRQTIVPVISGQNVRTSGNGGLVLHEHGLALMDTLNPLPDEGHDFWTSSMWSTRGWCMQERVLSRRRLIFTEEQVFWQCSGSTFCEETHFESSLSTFDPFYQGAQKHKRSLQQVLGEFEKPMASEADIYEQCWQTFTGLANTFCELDFTGEGDILDGFSGITQALTARIGETFTWGMPTSRFSQALMWADQGYDNQPYGSSSIRRRTARTTHPLTSQNRCLRIPSWSWLAWTGGLGINITYDALSTSIPELICFVHAPGGMTILPVDTRSSACFIDTTKLPEERRCFRGTWERSVDRTVTLEHIKQNLPDTAGILHKTPESILLFFWTSMSSFRVRVRDGQHQILTNKASLDPESKAWIYNTAPPIDGEDQYWVGSLSSAGDADWNKSLNRLHKEDDMCDFIVIGRNDVSYKPTLYVMCIGFHGEIAMRMGIGTINEDAWVANKPEWKLVALG